MRIYLVRHGESEGNKKKVFQDPQSPLSSEGVAQAEAVAKRFKGVHVDLIFASPFTRAKMTAEAISNKLHTEIEFWDDLHEIKKTLNARRKANPW
jgi:probable phosphoglycerate mutase